MAQGQNKALVGGTLIDGYGGDPIKNSVILIKGERIEAVGTIGALKVPKDYDVISTEGMSVLPGLWDMHVHIMINGHADYAYWDKTYPPLLEDVIMPASAEQLLMAGVTSARDLGGPLEEVLLSGMPLTKETYRERRYMYRALLYKTLPIRERRRFVGGLMARPMPNVKSICWPRPA